VSDPRERARNLLAKLAAQISAWDLVQNDQVFQKALFDIADHEMTAEIVAQFGGKEIPLMQDFAKVSRLDPVADAVAQMMAITAQTTSDFSGQPPLTARTLIRTREYFEQRLKAALSPAERHAIETFLQVQMPINHPIVRRRPPTRKKLDDGVSPADDALARAMAARLRVLSRAIFGKNGDRVTEVFVYVTTGVALTRHDRRGL
jgi:hypothetical protein